MMLLQGSLFNNSLWFIQTTLYSISGRLYIGIKINTNYMRVLSYSRSRSAVYSHDGHYTYQL